MLQSPAPGALEISPQSVNQTLPVLRWSIGPEQDHLQAMSAHRATPSTTAWVGMPTVGQSVLARMAALRTWVSGTVGYERHASNLWAQDQQDALSHFSLAIQDAFQHGGLAGLVAQLMAHDPLEKQVLLQRLINKIKANDERRQTLVEFARATAQMEKGTLDFLDNTAETFTVFNHIVLDGAKLLRSIVHELGENAQQGEIRASTLARAILVQLHDILFEDALNVLRQGIRADLRSRNPSPLSTQLLAAMSQKSVFDAVKLGIRIADDLSQRLQKIGIQGPFSKSDVARVVLIGAESGSTELGYLLERYLGPDVGESICGSQQALREFRTAFETLPITLWPSAWIHRRDRLLSNIDRRLVTSDRN